MIRFIAGLLFGICLSAYAETMSTSVNGVTPTCSGDLTGTYPNCVVSKINGVNVGTAATVATGTSGATLPLLNGQNTWSGAQIFPKSVIGSLPTCNAGLEGAHYGVTDALVPVALAIVAAGGAVHINVYCNGTNWIVG